ncbi:hypothetical protein PS918_00306 [Pseudomonas fluorescens]|uniref:DUF502 domain-containing protein n=1 Tax=Pseudomonas fluorescens TaxID=294 RepID=A0A5E7QVT2_PSEFL|nr:hypothetical protein [Pseudomonas fluorescens]VVP66161.1 hypothetical protein PS918_00306 [Pseudomonas fluorescens]
MFKFIKTTVLGGLLFILPLVLIIVLIEKAIHLLQGPVQKLVPMFSGYNVAGVTLVSVATLVGLVVMCFLAGLLARTAIAKRAVDAVEDKVLGNLPGYQLLKDATARIAGMDNEEGSRVGMIAEGEGWRLCLVLDAAGDWLAIYMPDGGPAGGTAGEVRLIPASQVVITDLPWLSLLGCLRRGGRGTLDIMAPWLPK